jgi:hypothetical protein
MPIEFQKRGGKKGGKGPKCRSFILGAICGLLVAIMLPNVVGCEQGPGKSFRPLQAVEAEQESLDTTKNYGETHKRTYPEQAVGVDHFFKSWQERIDEEKKALQPASQ